MRRLVLAALAAVLQACSTPPAIPPETSKPALAAGGATIQVNQVGFLPGAAKWAAVPATAAGAFSIVEAKSGRVAYRGALSQPRRWEPAHETLRLAEFSSLTAPGEYRVRVDGLPDSPRFAIAPDAYAALNTAAIRAFSHNRAGIGLNRAQAGAWARPAGHPDTEVLVHASAAGPGRPEGAVISAPKGWYDAGDYNKYVVNSGITMHTLLAAYEHFPAFFERQALNIPESGNGIPDLLDEALWNLDWMLAMQDPADGGVYHKLTHKGFDGVVMPHASTGPRYVVMKTTAATLDFAAVMAQASRVFARFETQRPGLSARTLAAAKAAWAWAQAHPAVIYRQPGDVHTGGYDDQKLGDEFAWAAAELYVTTRDAVYRGALNLPTLAIDVPGWPDVGSLAWITLAQHRAQLTAADRALVERRIASQASKLADAWAASPYRVAMQDNDFIWGSNAVALNQALMLIQGYRLTGERRQLDAAQAALDFVLGRNAIGSSMVTGFGERSPRDPHHRPSGADGVDAPVPGFIVGGPHANQGDAKDCPLPYPSKAPAKSWLDHFCSYTTNEVAINWNAPLVYVSAALQVLAPAVAAVGAKPRKILVVTTTLGWRHSSIEIAERVIASLGKSSGAFEVELASVTPAGSPDTAAYHEQVKAMLDRKMNPATLKQYHGIVFANTTGELPLPDKDAFIQWVRDGGAFIGVHSASDTLHGYRPYIEMLGGEFDHHREQVVIEAINRDASHPANSHLAATWNLEGKKEEIYLLKNYQPQAVRELIALDRHPHSGAAGRFPLSWSRDFGKGRVFYTALGHNEYVWQMPTFQQHLLGGIEWALRLK